MVRRLSFLKTKILAGPGAGTVLIVIQARKRKVTCCDLQSWTKLLRKLHSWGAFFVTILPSPPPPGSSVVGSSKVSRIPKNVLEATLNWGRGFSLRKAVNLEIVLLR